MDEPATPVVVRSTMQASSDRSFEFQAQATLRQGFTAERDAQLTELGVRMGANQQPYGLHLRLWINDAPVFERDYAGCVQRSSDWATVFDLADAGVQVRAGDDIAFELTPTASVGIEPLWLDDPDLQRGELPGYGAITARFYLSGRPLAPAPAPSPTSFKCRAGMNVGPHAGADVCILMLAMPENVTVPVGARAEWELEIEPGLQAVSTRWLPTGNPVGGYVVGDNSKPGRVLPLQINVQPVEWEHAFYWTAPGTYALEFEVTARPPAFCEVVAPQTRRGTCVVNVVGPSILRSEIQTTDVFKVTEEGCPALCLGDLDEGVVGCQMTAVVRVPAELAAGSVLRGLQLTRYRVEWTNAQSQVDPIIDSRDQEMLDDAVPYSYEVPCVAGDGNVIRENDSPLQHLVDGWRHLSVDQQFRMFIQWRCAQPGSIWVTLGIFRWFWRGGMLRLPNGGYAKVDPEIDFTARNLPNKRDQSLITGTELPQWTLVAKADQRVQRIAPGPAPQTLLPFDARTRSNAQLPQAGRRQFWVSVVSRPRPLEPALPVSPAEAAMWVGERLGEVRLADGNVRLCAWKTPPFQDNEHVFFEAQELTAADRMPAMDLSVRPGFSFFIFEVRVAPFCFGGEQAYWRMRARPPIRIDGLGEEQDMSMSGYTTRLLQFLPPGTDISAAGDGILRVRFHQTPTLAQLQAIAGWNQTHLVKRLGDAAVIDPSDPLG